MYQFIAMAIAFVVVNSASIPDNYFNIWYIQICVYQEIIYINNVRFTGAFLQLNVVGSIIALYKSTLCESETFDLLPIMQWISYIFS